jgi:tRNA modification GTPase
MAELQLHGGRAVVAAVLVALGRLDGFRPAEAGEFTRRAFENGRLDLTAVEGLADLIGAETEAQRRQAYRQLKGLLGDRVETWRGRLIGALALVEAGIDFSDEADVPEDLLQPALAIARALREEISAVLAQAGRGERLRDGFVVAIAGPPNAGKSTLLNRIAKREAAIVSPFAGTTRDVIEVHLDLDGYPVTLLDTAGVRETDDPVEREGVRRARERAASADLVLWVVSADRPEDEEVVGLSPSAAGRGSGVAVGERGTQPMADGLRRYTVTAASTDRSDAGLRSHARSQTSAKELGLPAEGDPAVSFSPSPQATASANDRAAPAPSEPSVPFSPQTPTWLIRNKADLLVSGVPHRSESLFYNKHGFIYTISALNGGGIPLLLDALTAHVRGFFGVDSGLLTRERHRYTLKEAESALNRALGETQGRQEIIAEELRLAARALGRLTGKVDVEDILDVIFRDFCIGK